MIQIVGALLVICGCAGVGYALSYHLRREEKSLEELQQCLDWMICEMNYQMPPLSHLFRGAAGTCKGVLSQFMECFAQELEHHTFPNVNECMERTLSTMTNIPEKTVANLKTLGTSLGQFDLDGQLDRLQACSALCKQDLARMKLDQDVRIRNNQTLSICAGVVLVIILL